MNPGLRLLGILAFAASCGAAPTSAPPELPAGEEADASSPAAKPAVSPADTPPKPTAPEDSTAAPLSPAASGFAAETGGLCIPMCVQQGQARAVSIDVVERDCAERCAQGPTPAPACVEAADAARARVDTVRMRGRAAKVWTELGRADLHCGYQDGLLRALREAGGLDDTARAAVLARALRADPFAEQLCPGGGAVTAEQTAVDAIRLCAIDDSPQGWHPDIDAQTFLVARAVELRWHALGLLEGDHKILLSTLRLSSALAGRARR